MTVVLRPRLLDCQDPSQLCLSPHILLPLPVLVSGDIYQSSARFSLLSTNEDKVNSFGKVDTYSTSEMPKYVYVVWPFVYRNNKGN